jgi:hypothetical protein
MYSHIKHSVFILFFLIRISLAFIPTTEERIQNALQSGFSHEPWRNDSVVIHWDFSFPRQELETLVEVHRWNMHMDWGRDVYQRMQSLYSAYKAYADNMLWCQEAYKACQKKCKETLTSSSWDKVILTTGSLAYDCFHSQCNSCFGNVMGEEVKEYLRLKDMNVPLYDRMIIGNWKE